MSTKKYLTLRDLVRRFIRWISRSNQAITPVSKKKDFESPGLRVYKFQRNDVREVSSWRAIYFFQGYNLEFGLDTLRHIDGEPAVRRSNPLATHSIYIIKASYRENNMVRKEVMFEEECVLEATFQSKVKDWAEEIFDRSIELLAKHPTIYDPDNTDWRRLFTAQARHYLGETHQVFRHYYLDGDNRD